MWLKSCLGISGQMLKLRHLFLSNVYLLCTCDALVVGRIGTSCSHTCHPWLRNLMGQELDSLTLQDIQQLEDQIDTSLNNIRSRKVQTHTL